MCIWHKSAIVEKKVFEREEELPGRWHDSVPGEICIFGTRGFLREKTLGQIFLLAASCRKYLHLGSLFWGAP